MVERTPLDAADLDVLQKLIDAKKKSLSKARPPKKDPRRRGIRESPVLNSPTWNSLIEQANAAGSRWAVWMTAALFDSLLLFIVFGVRVAALAAKGDACNPAAGCFCLIAARRCSPIDIGLSSALARWAPA